MNELGIESRRNEKKGRQCERKRAIELLKTNKKEHRPMTDKAICELKNIKRIAFMRFYWILSSIVAKLLKRTESHVLRYWRSAGSRWYCFHMVPTILSDDHISLISTCGLHGLSPVDNFNSHLPNGLSCINVKILRIRSGKYGLPWASISSSFEQH